MALKRELGFLQVFAVGAGAMISSGLFILPAIGFKVVGPGIFLCYLLAALLLLPSLLSKAELVTAMPKAGGTYFFIDRSLGPGFGTVGGIAAWASLAFKSAFALLGIGVFASYIVPSGMSLWETKIVACVCCVVFALINLLGVRHAGRLQTVLVFVMLAVLVVYSAAGVRHVNLANCRPLLPHGWSTLLMGAGMVFVSFGGVTKVATLGEEVRQPRRDVLLGMFGAYIVVSLLYVVCVFVTVAVLPGAQFAEAGAPLNEAAQTFWGRPGAILLGAAALAAFLTTGNAGILAASRTLMAMSRDGLVPAQLGSVDKKRGTPVAAIAATSAFMIAIILLLNLTLFVKAASAMKVLLFTLVMLSHILMRESRIPTYQPSWRAPLYPWPQIAGIVLYGFLLVELGTIPLAIAVAVLGGAVAWYAFYAKVHVMRESALVRVAGRLVAADFDDHDIEVELSRIARERDERVLDRFDHLIQDCTILDATEPMTRDDLFRVIAETLAPGIGLPPERVFDLLSAREQLATTVVRPGLAIPHLILEDVQQFQVLMVRSQPGVVFLDDQAPVNALFVLAASPAERDFYLQALVAVAEIAQAPDFDRKWRTARGPEALREAVLAAERRREEGWAR